MKGIYAYEAVAVVTLILVAISFSAKNWCRVRTNRIFIYLLHTSIWLTIADIALQYLRETALIESETATYMIQMVIDIGMMSEVVSFFLYFMSLTEHMHLVCKRVLAEILMPSGIMVVLFLLNPWTHMIFTVGSDGEIIMKPGMLLFSGISLIYVFGIVFMSYRHQRIISRGLFAGIVCLGAVHIAVVIVQMVLLNDRVRLIYFSADFMVVACYLFFQNRDRFTDRITGGLSRSGLRRVIRERCMYQEGFVCLAVNIHNYLNISNICSEDERDMVMQNISSVLRRLGGRHNLYHKHSSELVLLLKEEENAIKIYHALLEKLPRTLRVHDQNIAVSYRFYMLNIEETDYSQSDFFRAMTSMRNQVKDQVDGMKLMRYEGEVKEKVTLELFISRKLSQILRDRNYDLRFVPIADASETIVDLEVIPIITKDNREIIPYQEVWAVAKATGCINEVGRVVIENIFGFVTREKLFDRGIQRLHINVSSMHISSESIIWEYANLAKSYHIPFDRLCLEISEDISISQELLQDHMKILRSMGLSLLLDEYGDNICNIQSIMNQPFDMVKISGRMVHAYCSGDSQMLRYQIQMLHTKGWPICLENIDSSLEMDKIRDIGASYYQGDAIGKPISEGKLLSFIEQLM